VIIDIQNDFLPGGSLAIPRGNEVLSPLNGYLDLFQRDHLPIFATRDWHPANHCSFREQGGPWPVHCVQNSPGAEFAPALALPPDTEVISADTVPEQATYSKLDRTDFNARLQKREIRRLFIGGLATDYCVRSTVRDARKLGYEVCVLLDAVRPVDVQPGDGQRAIDEMIGLGCRTCTLADLKPQVPPTGTLLTDLYQLTMLQAYHERKMNDTAVFEFFVRDLPGKRDFLLAAGLEPVLDYLETLRFTPQELDWLKKSGHFKAGFVQQLETFRFTGTVHALPEGTPFFANEPVLRVTAPLSEAQLVETRIINLLQYSILVASKAARAVLAAPGKILIDFGLRRAHGAEAGLWAARSAYLAGFAGTATLQAGALWGIPLFGTMAHSFIQAHEDEAEAFESFARSHPENVVLLLDTYDVEAAAEKVVQLARRLEKENIRIRGVRLDSGDLAGQAKHVRMKLDEGGFPGIRIFVSGDLDETSLKSFALGRAPIDGYGIGTRLTTCADAPFLNCVYKLQEYAGQPCRKRSQGKSTLPGRKQVFRLYDARGTMERDILALDSERMEGEPLLKTFMEGGRRVAAPISLESIREHAAEQLRRLPPPMQTLQEAPPYRVEISPALHRLVDEADRRAC